MCEAWIDVKCSSGKFLDFTPTEPRREEFSPSKCLLYDIIGKYFSHVILPFRAFGLRMVQMPVAHKIGKRKLAKRFIQHDRHGIG